MMKKTLAFCAILLLATPVLASAGSPPVATPDVNDLAFSPLFAESQIQMVLTPNGVAAAPLQSAGDGLTLFTPETQPAYTWGACSQSCQPCLNNNQCPDFFGLPQKCMAYCP